MDSISVGLATPANLPLVEASDIVAYLVLQTSFLTTKQFKAYKSLEAYNQFVSGWVKDVWAWSVKGRIVVTGEVSSRTIHHSMHLRPTMSMQLDNNYCDSGLLCTPLKNNITRKCYKTSRTITKLPDWGPMNTTLF